MTPLLSTRIMSALRRWSRRETHRNAAAQRWQNLHAELTGKTRTNARRTAQHLARPPRHHRPNWWNAPTQAYPQIGRAGRLTPAQNWRSNGGQRTYQHASG